MTAVQYTPSFRRYAVFSAKDLVAGDVIFAVGMIVEIVKIGPAYRLSDDWVLFYKAVDRTWNGSLVVKSSDRFQKKLS